jgi:hypothetical protein
MVMDVMPKLVGALRKAGVPIIAGSDVGVRGHTLHHELELYVKAGSHSTRRNSDSNNNSGAPVEARC